MHYDFPLPEDALFPKMVVVSITNICDFACMHYYHPHYAKLPGYRRHTSRRHRTPLKCIHATPALPALACPSCSLYNPRMLIHG